jgi:hypothetical protein
LFVEVVTMTRMTIAFASLLFLGLSAEGLAERPKESPDSASHIVTGTVSKVFSREGKSTDEYLVQVRIDGIEKGEGYRKGGYIYAYAFRRTSDKAEPAAAGHTSVPKEGQRIKAWIKRGSGQMEALYPDWFEALKPLAED